MRHTAAAHDERDSGMTFQRHIVSGYALSIKVEWDSGAERDTLEALMGAVNTVMLQIDATRSEDTK